MNQGKNWPWSELELDGNPKDLKAVKRAYARKLKVTRPDENPEGFRNLREAFEAAKNEAQWAIQDDEWQLEQDEDTETKPTTAFEPVEWDPELFETDATKHTNAPIEVESDIDFSTEPETGVKTDPEQENWQRLWQLNERTSELLRVDDSYDEYDDEGNVVEKKKSPWGEAPPDYDVDTWREIVNDPALEQLDRWNQFSSNLRWKIVEHTGFEHGKKHKLPLRLPTDFAQLLADTFDWEDDENVHNPVIGDQGQFLLSAYRMAGVDVAINERPVRPTAAPVVDAKPRPPLVFRWYFILLAYSVLRFIYNLVTG